VTRLRLIDGPRCAPETRMETNKHCPSRYVIAGGVEQDTWFLISTSDNGQSKQNMNLDGEDLLLEFLRGVIAGGGRVIIEIPGSAGDDPEPAGLEHYPQPKRTKTK
jgi:hypothetical protein